MSTAEALYGDSRAKDWGKDKVAIFDATNSTADRRRWVLEECTNRKGKLPIGVVFVESICDDAELLEENYRFKIKNSPDYAGIPEEEALQDLRERVKKYEEAYEPISDDSQSYIKIFNLSTKIMVNHIYGRMSKLIVPALMAWHIGTRPVYLCRPGQTPSGVTLDGEDYVSSVDTSTVTYLNMSSHSQKRMNQGDKLGPAGLKFREELYKFVTCGTFALFVSPVCFFSYCSELFISHTTLLFQPFINNRGGRILESTKKYSGEYQDGYINVSAGSSVC